MKAEELRHLERDPRFIRGVDDYCDRWCERCPLSSRCLHYAIDQAEGGGDRAWRPLSEREFWDEVLKHFRTVDENEERRSEAKKFWIDQDYPELLEDTVHKERVKELLVRKNEFLAAMAIRYSIESDEWFEQAQSLFVAKRTELQTLARLGAGTPETEAALLCEFVQVIRWYQGLISEKLDRAIQSRAEEMVNPDPARPPKDSDGSAKIVLIALDRSIEAWSGLRAALDKQDETDSILALLDRLMTIRRDTEKLFPQARRFVRPGFDEPLCLAHFRLTTGLTNPRSN